MPTMAGSQEEVQLRRCRPTAFQMAPLTMDIGRGRARRPKSSHVWRRLRIPSARIGAMSATTIATATTKTCGCPPRPSKSRPLKLQPHRAAIGRPRDGAASATRPGRRSNTAKADPRPCSNQLRSLAPWSPSQTSGFRAVLRRREGHADSSDVARHHEYISHRAAKACRLLALRSYRCFWWSACPFSHEWRFPPCWLSHGRRLHQGHLLWIAHVHGATNDTHDTCRPVAPTGPVAGRFACVSTVCLALAACRRSTSTMAPMAPMAPAGVAPMAPQTWPQEPQWNPGSMPAWQGCQGCQGVQQGPPGTYMVMGDGMAGYVANMEA